MKKYFIVIGLILILGLAYPVYRSFKKTPTKPIPSTNNSSPAQISPTPSANALALPIAQFKERITKKPFGIYITPENSPVQPERFRGYHTGVDVEYEDVTTDVPVYAIADGTVVLARTASGYGGVIIIEAKIDGLHSILYGHIRPSSLPQVGQTFRQGDQMGVLGTTYSLETDGERRHLHFAVLSDNRIDLSGYVQNQKELSGWREPLSLY